MHKGSDGITFSITRFTLLFNTVDLQITRRNLEILLKASTLEGCFASAKVKESIERYMIAIPKEKKKM